MILKNLALIYTARCGNGVDLTNFELHEHPGSRATRLVDDTTRFLLVSIGKKAEDFTLRSTLSRWVREGVEMRGVRYRFLGFTESQVKAGKLMFFREDHEWTVKRLLANFGNLGAVYLKSGYGKYCARLGLSFSSTLESLDVPREAAHELPDLRAPDSSLYTDGCGMIRDSFAKRLCEKHDLPPETSVFQVRRGGIKGILVRYPDDNFVQLCGCSPSALIAYRPSMYKYDGGPTTLEINNYNQPPTPARLNVQFIVLLMSRGVPVGTFRRLLQDQLDLIDSILHDREKALHYIKGELDAGLEDDYNQSLFEMLLAQHDLSEPHVRQRLLQFQKSQYNTLRRKMNIRIADSCYLFGVVDEYGVLGPNEVHISLPSRSGILVRDVVVARNPTYHPGDIRKLRAVDHPSLRHHRNCIVFPRCGPRSIPDIISSGDLDGDMYFVAWEPTLLPPRDMQPLKRAASSLPSIASDDPTETTRRLSDMPRDAVETFMQLRFNRLMGCMANEWTRAVEGSADLANAELPRRLVPLIESALDMMKTGEDFSRLEREFKHLCRRHSIVRSDSQESRLQVLRTMIPHIDDVGECTFDCDPSLIVRDEDPHLWQGYIDEAQRAMPRYNKELSRAIQLDSENAAPDFALSSRTYPHAREPRQADRVRRDYQNRYFGGGPREEQNRQRIRASAWYYYGYSQRKASFAWLGGRYLNEIKACKSGTIAIGSYGTTLLTLEGRVVKRRKARHLRGRQGREVRGFLSSRTRILTRYFGRATEPLSAAGPSACERRYRHGRRFGLWHAPAVQKRAAGDELQDPPPP
ncbi:RdRP-domain-containing protein [Trametes polyzona]|nr:RdRP-domain-containing protein [Trametes polyzona]